MEKMSIAQGAALHCRINIYLGVVVNLRSAVKPLMGLIAVQLSGLSACSDPPVDEAKRVRISSQKLKTEISQKTEGPGNGGVETDNVQDSGSAVLGQETTSGDGKISSLPEFTYTLPPPPIPPFEPKELSIALAVHCGRCHDEWVFKKVEVIARLKKNNMVAPYNSIEEQITRGLMPLGNSQFAQSATGQDVLRLLDTLE